MRRVMSKIILEHEDLIKILKEQGYDDKRSN